MLIKYAHVLIYICTGKGSRHFSAISFIMHLSCLLLLSCDSVSMYNIYIVLNCQHCLGCDKLSNACHCQGLPNVKFLCIRTKYNVHALALVDSLTVKVNLKYDKMQVDDGGPDRQPSTH